MRRLAWLGLLLFSLAACAGAGADDTDEVTANEDSKADESTELRVRAGDTTLWMNQVLSRRDGAGGPELVMRGRTSRNLTGGRGFIFDDVYGDFAQRSARTFEVVWPVSTARGLVDGVAQFVGLDFQHSSTRPDSLTARAIVRPRMHSFTGSSRLYFTAELTPVVVGGRVVYRIKGHTTGATDYTSILHVELDGQSLTDWRVAEDQRTFEIDLDPEQALAIAGTATELVVSAYLPTGLATKRMKLGASIKRLGFTAGDVEAVWPPVSCSTTVKSCLQGMPDGTIDLAACGEAVAVNACAGQVGVFVDDVAFVATLGAADAQLSSAGFRTDATGLVGADRLESYLFNAKESVEAELQDLFGRWYLSTTTRDQALAGAVDAAIDVAVAHPIDLVDPIAPVAGNVAVTRHVVADALLVHIGGMDLRETEWARTMEELTREFRTWHVQSIRNFRETVSPEPWPSHPEWDLYVGDWLGAYVEVTVLKSTGAVVNVLLEID
jgi:hypothetical protein